MIRFLRHVLCRQPCAYPKVRVLPQPITTPDQRQARPGTARPGHGGRAACARGPRRRPVAPLLRGVGVRRRLRHLSAHAPEERRRSRRCFPFAAVERALQQRAPPYYLVAAHAVREHAGQDFFSGVGLGQGLQSACGRFGSFAIELALRSLGWGLDRGHAREAQHSRNVDYDRLCRLHPHLAFYCQTAIVLFPCCA